MDDTGVDTIGKLESTAKGVMKWMFYVVITIVPLGFFFWALLYSHFLSDFPFIIPVRNSYQEAYWKVGGLIMGKNTYPPFNSLYTIQPQKPLLTGYNTYTFIGTISKIDSGKYLLYLTGADQKTYIFDANFAIQSGWGDTWLIAIKVRSLQSLTAFPSYNQVNTSPLSTPSAQLIPTPPANTSYSSREILIQNNALSSPLTVVGIRWNDKRTLSQIETDYAKSPDIPLDSGSPESFILTDFSQ